MNSRKTVMIVPGITVTKSITKKNEKGSFKPNFYTLNLERNKIVSCSVLFVDERS